MNFHARWVVTSSVVLLGALVTMGSTSAQPTDSTAPPSEAQSNAAPPTVAATPAIAVPASAGTADVPPPVIVPLPDVSAVFAISGRDTQVNTRGFGDIGMQFQNTDVNAPILNDHISSQGNDNITNSNVGSNNVIVNNGSTCPGGFCH